MTREEAYQAMLKGHKITHRFFTEDEFYCIKGTSNTVTAENGVRHTDIFWEKDARESWRKDGWKIWIDPNCIITISNRSEGKFFFTTDHCQKHGLGAQWVSCTTALPITIKARECLPLGIITNKKEYVKVFEHGIDGKPLLEIDNPQPEYQA